MANHFASVMKFFENIWNFLLHPVTFIIFKGLQHRKSLPPPGRTSTTWEEYIGSPPNFPPPLGRPQVVKTHSKTFKAMIAMVSFDCLFFLIYFSI